VPSARTTSRAEAGGNRCEAIPLLTLESTVDLEGNVGPKRLTADDHTLVISNGCPDERREWCWYNVDGFRIEPSLGSCILQVQDEVGDMPLLMQSKVLRAIQEKEFQRIGGNQTIKSDVWIVAATNRDLDAMVASGTFRADLSFRLNGYSIILPPLRDRREDIPLLVEYYVRIFNAEIGKAITSIAPETMERLTLYSWPGNIRELQTILKHAMLHSVGPVLLPEFLPPELRETILAASPPAQSAAPPETAPTGLAVTADSPPQPRDAPFSEFIQEQLRGETHSLYADSVRSMESILLTHVLRYTRGNQSQAALILGITRGCLRNKLRQHGIMISSSIAIQDSTGESEGEVAVTATTNSLAG